MTNSKARDFVNQVNIQRRMKMSELEIEAAIFAYQCHDGQYRKYGSEPYICHPAEVASIVSQVTNDKETLAAAWLHDVVEDCGVDIELIGKAFGENVKKYVHYLTNPSQLDPALRKLGRVQRKAADREHMLNAPAEAKTVKLADILSNINSLVYNDPSFARVWVKEKYDLMSMLEGGNIDLLLLVKNNVNNSKEFLKV
jgi:(p)ppGpp synthase/HD superfamily hydrolase